MPACSREILNLIGTMYGVEGKVDGALPELERLERLAELRDRESRPVVERIQTWLRTTPALPESGLGKAMAYARELWPGLVAFLDDPRIPLDNNLPRLLGEGSQGCDVGGGAAPRHDRRQRREGLPGVLDPGSCWRRPIPA